MIDTFMPRIFVIWDRISRPLSREGTIYWELWIRSQQPVSRKQNNPVNSNRSRPSESSSVPKGYCFKFHKGGDCLGCAFTHSCPKCQGAHRMSVCTFRGQSKQTTRTIAVMSKKDSFLLHCDRSRESMQAANLSSALQQPQVVDAKLANELAAGRLAGPFQTPPISPYVVLPPGCSP